MIKKLFQNKIFLNIYYRNVDIFVQINKNLQIKSNVLKIVILIILAPLLIIRCIFEDIYDVLIASKIIKKYNHRDLLTKYKYDLSIAIIVRNEAPYIQEWIEYHRMIGVNHIYLYDDRSEDCIYEILKNYIVEGYITYYKIDEEERNKYFNMQTEIYNRVIKTYKQESRYIAFIDADEFLVSNNESLLNEVIKINKEHSDFGGVGINWACYGSSGYKTKPEGLVIENYLYRANDNYWNCAHIKTIVNPRLVKNYISAHFPMYRVGAHSFSPKGEKLKLWSNGNIDYTILRINHYACKSYQEFINKINKGMVTEKNKKYTMEEFVRDDTNEIYDDNMLKYVDEIKERIKNVQRSK